MVLIWFLIQYSFNSFLFGFLFKLCYNLLLISPIKSCAILRFCRIWRNYVQVLLDLSCNLFAKALLQWSSKVCSVKRTHTTWVLCSGCSPYRNSQCILGIFTTNTLSLSSLVADAFYFLYASFSCNFAVQCIRLELFLFLFTRYLIWFPSLVVLIGKRHLWLVLFLLCFYVHNIIWEEIENKRRNW